jgi:hypothetical protein
VVNAGAFPHISNPTLTVTDATTVHVTEWKYKGVCDDARLRTLQTSEPFDDIADRLERGMKTVCCHTTDCCDMLGYKRTIYCVEIGPKLFDLFFNSQSGYRGAYFQSPERGLSANRLLLRTVAPRLVAWTSAHSEGQDPEFAAASLSRASAKAWLAEQTLSLCERCKGEWSPTVRADLEISNGRWECDSHMHAVWGRQAPWFAKVRFIGAFLSETGEEYVASRKKHRARDIWARGWS